MATPKKAAPAAPAVPAAEADPVTLRALTPIRHGAEEVAEGGTFECEAEEAAILIALDAAEAA